MRKPKNKQSLKLFLPLFILVLVAGAIFISQKPESDYTLNPIDLKIAQYSDRIITENAIKKDPKFRQIAFGSLPKKREIFHNDQIATVFRAFKMWLLPRSESETQSEYGTWIWTPIMQMTDEYMESILDGAKKEGINVVYLSIDSYLDIYTMQEGRDKEEKEKSFAEVLENFLIKAKERNIEVDAEAGWKNWAEEGHTYKAFAVANYVKNFNNSHTNKFRGFQYDVEPYLLDSYKVNNENKENILRNFVKLVDQTAYFLAKSDLKFSIVIPSFYDKKDNATPQFSYNNRKDYAFGHLLKILENKPVSSIIVMSYRNFAKGEDGSIALSKNEFRTVSKGRYSTNIILAQETGDVLPPSITFHNLSRQQFLSESKKLTDAFKPYSSFQGLAIHYANAFLELK